MMSEISAGQQIPKRAALAGLFLVGLATLFAGVARTTDFGATRVPPSPVVEQVDLRFLDNPAGGVRVETNEGRIVANYAAGEGGFLRGVMRGFARDRRAHEGGSQESFSLARHADGRLTIEDPVTGRVVELESFGPSNAGLFSNLLKQGRAIP
jgi:putative photosynthetic complex assembly protein